MTVDPIRDRMPWRKSLRHYTYYVVGSSCYGWAPLFFLYMQDYCTMREVLWLESMYYLTVFCLEVPSGYFSDRFGRKRTLLLSATTLACAYLTFAIGRDFATFAIAQVLLAAGISLNSGTDTSFHLATLYRLGEQEDYGDREASLAQKSLLTSALAALLGGALGILHMSLGYVLSTAGALLALYAATRFEEPLTQSDRSTHLVTEDDERLGEALIEQGLLQSLRECIVLIRSPRLWWFFVFASSAIVLNHIPYEFYQPYIGLLERGLPDLFETRTEASSGDLSTLWTGLHLMAAQLLSAWVAGKSTRLSRKVGVHRYLLLSMALQVVVIASMACFFHPVIAFILLLRGWPSALQNAPLREHITPYLPERVSATYLSLQSLTGRLCFGLTLLLLSHADQLLSWLVDATWHLHDGKYNLASQDTPLHHVLLVATLLSLSALLLLGLLASVSKAQSLREDV